MANQWMITADKIDNGESNGRKSAGFKSGVKMPVLFKMYDDDNILYFEGVMQEQDFHPLDEYGVGFGCTGMKTSINGKPFTWL